jgi:hypothetical protein
LAYTDVFVDAFHYWNSFVDGYTNAGQSPELEILSYQPWLIPLAFIGILLVVAGPG